MKVNVSKEITSKQQNYILLISLLGVLHLILDITPKLKLCGKKKHFNSKEVIAKTRPDTWRVWMC